MKAGLKIKAEAAAVDCTVLQLTVSNIVVKRDSGH
jgi:hypothetical protein